MSNHQRVRADLVLCSCLRPRPYSRRREWRLPDARHCGYRRYSPPFGSSGRALVGAACRRALWCQPGKCTHLPHGVPADPVVVGLGVEGEFVSVRVMKTDEEPTSAGHDWCVCDAQPVQVQGARMQVRFAGNLHVDEAEGSAGPLQDAQRTIWTSSRCSAHDRADRDLRPAARSGSYPGPCQFGVGAVWNDHFGVRRLCGHAYSDPGTQG